MFANMKCWAAVFMALVCQAQENLSPETLRLSKIKTTVRENLHRLPNYTCTETIQRSERPIIAGKGKLMMLESFRLEVAYLDGKELFGWPGSAKIDEADLGKLINGSIGNGYFGLFPNNIFSTPTTTFKFVDAVDLNGQHAIRYDYRVPQFNRAYRLSNGFGEAAVGFHGSFWVNAITLDLMRITVIADDPPVVLGIASATSVLDFERYPIGSSTFLLPRGAELVVVDTNGTENRSRLSFAACHMFVGESVLKFDDPAAEPAVAPAKTPVKVIALPDDFTVDFNLETSIDWAAAGGDPVHATFRDSVLLNGAIAVPKGARLSGRIAHLAMRGDLYHVELVLTSLDFAGGHADLTGRRNGVSLKDVPLIFRSAKFKLARGVRLTLHSRLLKSVHNDSIRPRNGPRAL
jgi:hypothetical protein